MRAVLLAGIAALGLAPAIAEAQDRPDQKAFFSLYKELVETNTVVGVGSCTKAASQIATRLKAAGYSDSDITLFSVPEHPEDGGVVAILPDQQPKAGDGEFAPFFGVQALTMTLLSRLADRTGSPVLLAWCERVGDGPRFDLHIEPAPAQIADADPQQVVHEQEQGRGGRPHRGRDKVLHRGDDRPQPDQIERGRHEEEREGDP